MDTREVYHPFLGYVVDPTRAGYSSRDFGFPGERSIFEPAAPGRLRVVVVGGSVANWLATSYSAILREALAASAGRPADAIDVFAFALGGYKQPQQLMTVAYLLALGARFDWLINIDGFNDVALHGNENDPKGIDLSYPRAWYFRFDDFKDARVRLLAAEVSVLLDRKAALIERWAGPFAPIGRWLAGRIDRRLARADAALRAAPVAVEDYRIVGRGRTYRDSGEMFAQLVALWRDSSIQIDALCRANAIAYFHVLQPNQYHPGSKPMDEGERRLAVAPYSPFRISVPRAYPLLIEAGHALRARGIAFIDLTMAFARIERALYVDTCCHYSEEGNRILADAIGTAIKAARGQ